MYQYIYQINNAINNYYIVYNKIVNKYRTHAIIEPGYL